MSGPEVGSAPKITYLTAGAAGMYCGSCMHDNTLVRALSLMGIDIQLVPTYTPIRTDEEDVSVDRVFFGGINVYLQQKVPLLKHVPRFVDRWFDNPRLLRWISNRAMDMAPAELGALTVSMLKGQSGFQRKEVQRLCDWLAGVSHPDLVVLSNMLIGGCVTAIKQRLNVPVLVTLQGDDLFLDQLPDPYRQAAIVEIQRLVPHVDGFLVNSRYYAQHMGQSFGIPPEKMHLVPLGIDTAEFPVWEPPTGGSPIVNGAPTIGYLARLAPEKGLHVLVDAFIQLKRRPGMERARLRVAGWLGPQQSAYANQQFDKLRAAGLADDFDYLGEVDRRGKIQMLRSIHVLSVPTTYQDPKGLFVLEALACGVPVVQPAHGSFPELMEALGGGLLVRPDDPSHLAETLADLIGDEKARNQLAQTGYSAVRQRHGARAMAEAMLAVYQRFLER